jgi:hypothetical protein
MDTNLGPNLGQVRVGSGSNHGSEPNVTTPNVKRSHTLPLLFVATASVEALSFAPRATTSCVGWHQYHTDGTLSNGTRSDLKSNS